MKKPRSLRQILLAAIGKAWMYWPPRLEAKKRAKVPGKAGWYRCELCKAEVEKIDIDHITPIVRPAEGFTTWDSYIANRFVENANALQAICTTCHRAKSKSENAKRRKK